VAFKNIPKGDVLIETGVQEGINFLTNHNRERVEKAGYSDYSHHALGHGIGTGHLPSLLLKAMESSLISENLSQEEDNGF
jgi:hypothetical protein